MQPFHAQVADTLADYNSEVDSIRAKSVASVKVGKRSFTMLFILNFAKIGLVHENSKKETVFSQILMDWGHDMDTADMDSTALHAEIRDATSALQVVTGCRDQLQRMGCNLLLDVQDTGAHETLESDRLAEDSETNHQHVAFCALLGCEQWSRRRRLPSTR
jgi:hypothetical protein